MSLRQAAQQALEAWFRPHGINYVDFKPYMEALRAALAEPEQIEDAIVYGSAWSKDGKRIDPMSVYKEPEQEPVAWAGLTDEEILAEIPFTGHRPITSFARAIEAKLKEKNT